jgi:hypothetical protein
MNEFFNGCLALFPNTKNHATQIYIKDGNIYFISNFIYNWDAEPSYLRR